MMRWETPERFAIEMATASVGEGAKERAAERDEDACYGGAVAPEGLAVWAIADDDVGEIGGE